MVLVGLSQQLRSLKVLIVFHMVELDFSQSNSWLIVILLKDLTMDVMEDLWK